MISASKICWSKFQHTAARRRLLFLIGLLFNIHYVSTHSRPKAAASFINADQLKAMGFNTQPPEGGCHHAGTSGGNSGCFNTQPPEGGCTQEHCEFVKALMFQHTAARRRLPINGITTSGGFRVSTHSRPKAAANCKCMQLIRLQKFQHTAARRRLLS